MRMPINHGESDGRAEDWILTYTRPDAQGKGRAGEEHHNTERREEEPEIPHVTRSRRFLPFGRQTWRFVPLNDRDEQPNLQRAEEFGLTNNPNVTT